MKLKLWLVILLPAVLVAGCVKTVNDEKTAGVEIIHHGVRNATGGAVRLSPTPEQWDQIPKVVDRKVDLKANTIAVTLRYEAFDFDSRLVVTPAGAGFRIAVYLDQPLPASLEGAYLAGAIFESTLADDLVLRDLRTVCRDGFAPGEDGGSPVPSLFCARFEASSFVRADFTDAVLEQPTFGCLVDDDGSTDPSFDCTSLNGAQLVGLDARSSLWTGIQGS